MSKNLLLKKAKSVPTILQINETLKEHEIAWSSLDINFNTSFGYANALKSLKSVAKQYPFLQPYFKQISSTNIYATLDPSTEQNFDEAIKCKDKTLMVQQHINYKLAFKTPNINDTLKQLSQVLVDFPPKNYKYVLSITFDELDFGPNTLVNVTDDYIEGREEYMKNVSPIMRASIAKLTHSFIQFSDSGTTLRLTTHCLLPESSTLADINKLAVPEKFTTFVHSLWDFKPNEIKRIPIYSTTELKQQKEAATEVLAKRTTLSVEEIKEASVDYYNKLTLDQIEKYRKIPSLPKISIYGIECFAIPCDREKFDHKKILNKCFKPLGYEAVKQGIGSVGYYEFKKQLLENESLVLRFDFGSWRQTIRGYFLSKRSICRRKKSRLYGAFYLLDYFLFTRHHDRYANLN